MWRRLVRWAARLKAGRKPGAELDRQIAALPFKVEADGSLRVCLITSRDGRRMLTPKGWPMRGKPDHRAAAIEAQEEAGLVGTVGRHPVGRYIYRKGGVRRPRPIQVDVYLLAVERQLSQWREKGQRTVLWLPVEAAAARVDEGNLAKLIRDLPAQIERNGSLTNSR